MISLSSSVIRSSSSSSCFLEKPDSSHLYYQITLWDLIKKKDPPCLLGPAGMTNALRIVKPGSCVHADAHTPAEHLAPICSVSGIYAGNTRASVGCLVHL
ncbi:hypothetical protein ILYODFUR_036144 [Ilyodon furcidens]|uniref:Uncharacterized protein n=1 Tax=Ilyodon furcidens TaxID=33524 RepID=A0ABV0V9P9_9TELE